MLQVRRVAALVALLALGAALRQQLRRPPAERTWHGTVAGVVPYDFRPPTVGRLRAAVWDPEGRLVTGQVFGVGWTLNLGRLARRLGLV